VLFPTTDTAVLTLAAIQSDIAPHVTNIPDRPVVETMVIKTRFYPSVREQGIPHPRTLNPQDTSIETIIRHLHFPVYIRPAQPLLFGAHFAGKGFVAHTIHELHAYLQRVTQVHLEVMIQEIIPGPTTHGFGMSGYMDRHGQVLAFYAVQKLRQPSMFSNASVNVTVPRAQLNGFDTRILDYLRRMQYRGIFGTEMKWDARDRCFKFFEVNARSMGGNYLGVACGANHVLAAYRDALGIPVEPTPGYASGVHYIELVYDLTTMLQRAWRDHE
jgi:predicted ATP-grasp superfamily ATP-dependent carboligase